MKGRLKESHDVAKRYIEWFGTSNYFVELQQNRQAPAKLGQSVGAVRVVAVGNLARAAERSAAERSEAACGTQPSLRGRRR